MDEYHIREHERLESIGSALFPLSAKARRAQEDQPPVAAVDSAQEAWPP